MLNKHVVIPIFVPHNGCPHDCIFCNQKIISGQTDEMSVGKMHSIIQAHLKTILPDTYVEIGFYGGSFTGIERHVQMELLSGANEYIKNRSVSSIRLSTRPDYINTEILEYLEFYNVNTIELGVQSLDEDVLKASCRGHNTEDVFRSSSLIKEFGFNLGLQTMVGLPCDCRDKDIYTAEKVIEIMPSIVRIYPVLVIKGTYLEKMFLDGSYSPPELDEAVDICAQLLEMYEGNNIKVIRMGLQANENIDKGSEVVAGPVHPAFRQLVEARRALKYVEDLIIRQGLEGSAQLTIQTGSCNISNVIGQKRSNLDLIKSKYSIGNVKVEGCMDLNKEILINRRSH